MRTGWRSSNARFASLMTFPAWKHSGNAACLFYSDRQAPAAGGMDSRRRRHSRAVHQRPVARRDGPPFPSKADMLPRLLRLYQIAPEEAMFVRDSRKIVRGTQRGCYCIHRETWLGAFRRPAGRCQRNLYRSIDGSARYGAAGAQPA